VFVIGDAANVPTSKTGSVTHFDGETLVENVRRFLAGEPLSADFDGHANCFIETGFRRALLIDFNYDTEPLPGHYPTRVGLPLLKEARLNHLGKLMFQWFYWHSVCRAATSPASAPPCLPPARHPPRLAARERTDHVHHDDRRH
jgi:sulfide:quinone oxidoreductase